jgi:glycosyltransferase involved in cell wall biosynthesis
VATVHGFQEPVRYQQLKDSLQAWATFRLLRHRFDHVIAVSGAMREQLIATHGLSPKQVHTVVNGIAIPDEEPHTRTPTQLHIGSVGRLVPVKRFGLFLEIAALLRQRFSHLRFSILGEGADRDLLAARATRLGLDDCFTLMPHTANPWPYYRSLDVYLNTSELEGLPLSLLEAMATGTPVVAPAVGGIPEVVRHGSDGFVVKSSDAGDFADACARLILDGDLRARLGEKARVRVRNEFSAAAMSDRYRDLYRGIMVQSRDAAAETFQNT